MRGSNRIGVAVTVLVAGWVSGCAANGVNGVNGCTVYQSPRRLVNFDNGRRVPAVKQGPGDTILYTPSGSTTPTSLRRCGQHYHCWIENFQGCPGQRPTVVGGPPQCPVSPPADSWVEIHTIYSPEVGENCDPETLACCKGSPVVVMGYHAKVTGDALPGGVAVPVHFGPEYAEWQGSDTGPDPGNDPQYCRPIAAFWSFTLRCDLTVSQGQLSLFHKQDPARRLQPADRLSHPLVEVRP